MEPKGGFDQYLKFGLLPLYLLAQLKARALLNPVISYPAHPELVVTIRYEVDCRSSIADADVAVVPDIWSVACQKVKRNSSRLSQNGLLWTPCLLCPSASQRTLTVICPRIDDCGSLHRDTCLFVSFET